MSDLDCNGFFESLQLSRDLGQNSHRTNSALHLAEIMQKDLKHCQNRFLQFCGYILTCKKENTDEWMECLVDTLNLTAKYLECGQQFEYRNGQIKEKSEE